MAKKKNNKKNRNLFEYDVCLSFAGEDRTYVKKVANKLQKKGIRVFYDEYEDVNLWGKNLYEHLADIYSNSARFCIMFISAHYASKLWTNHERQNAQTRAFKENKEYILPVRFDKTKIPGLLDTIGYINLKKTKPEQLAEKIITKLGPQQHKNFMPPRVNNLIKFMKKHITLNIKKQKKEEIIEQQARSFFDVLTRLSQEELLVLFLTFLGGCIYELPKNTHKALDLLGRETGFSQSKIIRLIGGLRSLGVFSSIKKDKNKKHLVNCPQVNIEYHVMSLSQYGGNATDVAWGMIHCAIQNNCEEHGLQKLLNLDFSQLDSSTQKKDIH